MDDDEMNLAIEQFKKLGIEEQIQVIEQQIGRLGGDLPMARLLLRQLKEKLKHIN